MLLQYKLLYKKGIFKWCVHLCQKYLHVWYSGGLFCWYFRFCLNSCFSFWVLLGSLQQNHDLGFFFLFPPQPFHDQERDAVVLWTRILKIGLLGWIDQVLSVRFIDFTLFDVSFFRLMHGLVKYFLVLQWLFLQSWLLHAGEGTTRSFFWSVPWTPMVIAFK